MTMAFAGDRTNGLGQPFPGRVSRYAFCLLKDSVGSIGKFVK